MPAYVVEVEETIRRTVTVHAVDRSAAWQMAKRPAEWQDHGDSGQRIDFEVVDVIGFEPGTDEMQAFRDREAS